MRERERERKPLEEYCRIKVDITCVFLFCLNIKYTSQIPMSITSLTKLTNLPCLTLTSKS